MPDGSDPNFVIVGDGGPAQKAVRHLIGVGAEIKSIYTTERESRSLVNMAETEQIPWVESAVLSYPQYEMPTPSGNCWLINAFSPVILPARILGQFPHRALNLHNGPLPLYAGINVTQWAIRNGETNFGCTVHEMTGEVDGGPIVGTHPFEIGAEETGLEVFRNSMAVGSGLLIEILETILAGGTLDSRPQNKSRRRVYTNREARDSVLDWSMTAEQVQNFVRAANYRPLRSPTYQALWKTPGGKVVDLARARVVGGPDGQPGDVLSLGPDGPVVACGESALALTAAYHEGTKLDEAAWPEILSP